jgi:hypothetical protein
VTPGDVFRRIGGADDGPTGNIIPFPDTGFIWPDGRGGRFAALTTPDGKIAVDHVGRSEDSGSFFAYVDTWQEAQELVRRLANGAVR